jgi:hypothetical protein
MDLVVFRPEELAFVLGALRNVAASDGAISPGERALVEGIARIHGTTVDFDRVESVTPDRVAAAIQDPHRRKRLVQLAIVAALTEGTPVPEREAAVDALAKALEIPDTGVNVIRKLSHGHTIFARFDVLRRMRNFMTSHDKAISFAELLRTLGITEDAELAGRYRALANCAEDSFGRAFHSFYEEHGFGLPGEKHGINEDFLFHDAGHVLSGYGVDPQGEIQQAAFQAGFVRNDGFLFLLFGILQFHIGIRLTPIAKAEEGLFDVDRVLRAATRGAACKLDLSDHFSIFKWKDVPLQTMRADLGIPPL